MKPDADYLLFYYQVLIDTYRSMSEVMVDYGYAEQVQDTRSGYSGRSSTYTEAVSSTHDRSGTEIVETDHYIESASAYYGAASHHTSSTYRTDRR